MKKSNLIKGLLLMGLGFGAVAITTPVIFAEEVEATTQESVVEETTQEESNQSQEQEATSVVEETTQEATTEETSQIIEEKSSLGKMLEKLSKTEIKAILTALCLYLGTDLTTILALAIYLIKTKSKQTLQNETYQSLKAKSDKEFQDKLTTLENEWLSKIDNLTKTINTLIANQSSEQRKNAEKTIDDILKSIQETKTDLD